MAKKAKSTQPTKARPHGAKPAAAPPPTPQPAPESGIPRVPFAARPTLTHEMIARRAFEIHCSETGGSELDNWLRAERELREELGIHEPS